MDYLKILLTSLVTLLASSGFWSYRIKKLERKYAMQDKSDETQKKLDKIIKMHEETTKKIEELSEQNKRTDAVTMAVARDRIYDLCARAIRTKNPDPDMMRDIRSILDPYKENGGNGIADEYFNRYEHMYKTATYHTETSA